MAYGDVGGAITELIITCKAKGSIKKGDPLCLTCVAAYEVSNNFGPTSKLFGQSMASVEDGEAIPVMHRGIAIFSYIVGVNIAAAPYEPELGKPISGSDTYTGSVVGGPHDPWSVGIVLKVDEAARLVHVLF